MDDLPFAEKCREIAERGAESILATFNGEYFVQLEDSQHKDKIVSPQPTKPLISFTSMSSATWFAPFFTRSWPMTLSWH